MEASTNGQDAKDCDGTNHDIAPTELLYMKSFDGNFQLECHAYIIAIEYHIETNEEILQQNNRRSIDVSIVLDRTVLYPQDGGQPCDNGKITIMRNSLEGVNDNKNSPIIIDINRVVLDRSTGIVRHTGTLDLMQLHDGNSADTVHQIDERYIRSLLDQYDRSKSSKSVNSVQVQVNNEIRRFNSECHTVGHVVDAAMERCDFLRQLQVGKAYHYMQGPYVEYIGTLSGCDMTSTLHQLQEAFQYIIRESIPTTINLVTKKEAEIMCPDLDMNVYMDPVTELVRIVTIAGVACPCGGTHAGNTGDLLKWSINSIKCKKGIVRVKYGMIIAG